MAKVDGKIDFTLNLNKCLPYSGYFSRGVYFADFAQRAQFANFEISKIIILIIENGCGQLECSLLPL